MVIEAGHGGDIYTRETLLDVIAEDQGADSARFAGEPNPGNNQSAPQTQQQPGHQELPVKDFNQQVKDTVQDVQQTPVAPATPNESAPAAPEPVTPEPIALGQPFEVPQQQYQPQQQPQVDIDALIEQKLAERLTQKQDAATEGGEAQPAALTKEDMQAVINETFQQREQAQYIESQRENVITNYESNLEDKLRNAGVDIDNNGMLQDWIVYKFKEGVDKVRNHIQRDLTPREYMEVANWHTKEVEQRLNMSRPQAPAPKGNVTMMNSGQPASGQQVAPQANYSNLSVEQIHKEAEQLASKTGGRMRPSDATKYARALMKANGQSKMRF